MASSAPSQKWPNALGWGALSSSGQVSLICSKAVQWRLTCSDCQSSPKGLWLVIIGRTHWEKGIGQDAEAPGPGFPTSEMRGNQDSVSVSTEVTPALTSNSLKPGCSSNK